MGRRFIHAVVGEVDQLCVFDRLQVAVQRRAGHAGGRQLHIVSVGQRDAFHRPWS